MWIIGNGGLSLTITRIVKRDSKIINGYIGPSGDFEDSVACSKSFHPKNGILAIGIPGSNISIRLEVHSRFSAAGWNFQSVLSKTAIMNTDLTGKSIIIQDFAYIGESVSVGDLSLISTGAVIEHNSTLNENVFVGPNATICGGCTIGKNTIIGAGAVVLPNSIVPEHHIVKAGSVYRPE